MRSVFLGLVILSVAGGGFSLSSITSGSLQKISRIIASRGSPNESAGSITRTNLSAQEHRGLTLPTGFLQYHRLGLIRIGESDIRDLGL